MIGCLTETTACVVANPLVHINTIPLNLFRKLNLLPLQPIQNSNFIPSPFLYLIFDAGKIWGMGEEEG